ncbi:hypothetical protein GGS23DRAFT_579062 [Durotheca rogersii]|uniref:uncharacterized protein n=1 Tax=Durotheca rogersii TaxID=419775 RepID=UPI00221F8E6A|nr:uncharacterized protein GGS23DRAFT_579062 [Durotheca rogersii]KAI5860821.1 hypothetical protein GGS23DRAFT_579062 [Durotheca rogersii]
MFSIDRAMLPSLPTRRALIVVDPQNDFLAEDGALPIQIPIDLPERLAGLVTAFRKGGGDIIWACSQFETSRSVFDEQVLTLDRSGNPRSPDHARGRRRQEPPQTASPSECAEAFLTQESAKAPICVRPGTSGIEMHPIVKEAMGSRDHTIVKSYYSAFRSENLLRVLRTRLVTELFICGAMTNTSIMATAVDAASHGYTITIVDDCCGYHNVMRHRAALKQISNMTGCAMLPAETVLASFKPKPKVSRRPGDRPATSSGRYPTVRRPAGGKDDSLASSTSQIQSSFENLSLSAKRADDDNPDLQAPAPDPAPSLQPLVRPVALTDEKSGNESGTSSSATKPGAASSEKSQKTLEDDESQGKGEQDNKDDAPTPARDKRSSLPNPQGDEIITSNTSDEPQSPEQRATLTPDPPVIQSDHTSPPEEKDDPSTPEGTPKLPDATGRAPSDEGTKREEAPAETRKTEVENSGAMTSHDAITPSESGPLCEGDTKVMYEVLPSPLSENIFERTRDEVQWQRMSHQGGEVPRLVAVQGQVDEDGSMPIYRHPADESPPLLPFSPTVLEIKNVIEKRLGHPLNHVLIQFYRDGKDYISEHSDKTLDIARGSFIANVSLGAERTMTFRTKRRPKTKAETELETAPDAPRRQIERTRLPHNSLCRMGLATNMRWLHGIRQDKRMDREKSAEELAYGGGRISLTFRQIATFLDRESRVIWGQGATAKTREAAKPVVNGQTQEAVKMLQGFGRENQSTEFDWDEFYGGGFDVLHISASPRLFLSSDPVANMRIQLMLAEYKVNYARGSMSPLFRWKEGKPAKDPGTIPSDLPIKFVDNDSARTTVQGEVAIMSYLDRAYSQAGQDKLSREDQEKQAARFQQGIDLLSKRRADPDGERIKHELAIWEGYAAEGNDFIAASTMTLADFAFWPVLHDIIGTPGQSEFAGDGQTFENLKRYHERIKTRGSGQKVLAASAECSRERSGGGTPETTAPAPASASAPTSPTSA